MSGPLHEEITERVGALLADIARDHDMKVADLLPLAETAIAQEREAQSYLKVVRTSPRAVTIKMQGVYGIEEFQVIDADTYQRVTRKVRGRAMTIRPETADWHKVMKVYREAGV